MFTDGELVARFTIKWMDAEGYEDLNHLSEEVQEAILDQILTDYSVFKINCDNSSKKTQLSSIEKYLKG